MNHYTPISNILFDTFLPTLTSSELKILLIVLRQSSGWRKERDRMTGSQLENKTGLSRRIIASGIQSLIDKRLLIASDFHKNTLNKPVERKGKTHIYFSSPLATYAKKDVNLCKREQNPMQKLSYNKRNITKETRQGDFENLGMKKLGDMGRIQQIIAGVV